MSIQAISAALESKMKPGPKFVLVALANYANDKGDAWPSLATLSRVTSMSRPTVIRHLKELCEIGAITQVHREKEDGSLGSNLYHLVAPCDYVVTEQNGGSNSTLPEPSLNLPSSETNVSSEREIARDFADWWATCHLKVAKGQARKAYRKAWKAVGPAVLLSGMRRYAGWARDGTIEAGFAKYPATWLNGECWDDEQPPPRIVNYAQRSDAPTSFTEIAARVAAQKVAARAG